MQRLATFTVLIYLCVILTSCGTTPTVTDWSAADSDRALERLEDGEEIIFQAQYSNLRGFTLPDQRLGSMLTLTDQRIYFGNASISYAEISSAKLDHPLLPYYVTLNFFDEPSLDLRLTRRTWGEMRNINRLHRIIEKKLLEVNQIRERIQKESLPTTTIKDINRKVAEEMRRRSLVKQQKRHAEVDRRLGIVGIVLRNRTEDVTFDRRCEGYGAGGGAIGTGIPPIDLIIFVGGMATAISQDIEKLKCESRSDPRLDTVGEALMESLSRVRSEGTIHGRITRSINRTLGSPAVELTVSDNPVSIKGKIDTLIELEPILGIVQTTNRSGTYGYYLLNTILDVRLIRVKDSHVLDKQRYQHVSKHVCHGEKADCEFDESLKEAFSYFGYQLARDVLK